MEDGLIIDNRYELQNLIGKGGMSEVYLANDLLLNKKWAIKKISKNGIHDGKICVMSATAEINILKKLDHPLLPRIVDIMEDEKNLYVIMDYIKGITLREYLEKRGPVKEKTLINWAKDLIDVLAYLHGREPAIIYRDLKPDNIMLTDEDRIKLIDFGIAREYKIKNDKDTVYLGTRGYAAPEQFGGDGQTDERTDIYCLGATLYHLVTGKSPSMPPYKIYPIRYWDKKLSIGLEKIIQKCTETNPCERYQSVGEILFDINNIDKANKYYLYITKLKIYIFRTMLFVSLFCVYKALYIKEGAVKKNERYYDYCIEEIKKSSGHNLCEKYIDDAFKIKKNDYELWKLMISSYKEDGMFTSDEEGKLIRRYDELTMEDIDSFNGELEYEIAKMYWYYYVYDEEADLKNTKKNISDNNSGVTASISWLEKALDKKMINKEDENRAAIMLGIATFHKNISVCEKESIDKGMYYEFVCNVKEMIMLIKNEDNDNLKIRFLFKEISGIDSYLLKIKIDGVDRKDIYYICTETDNILKSISEKNISIDDLQKYKKIREILKNIHDKIPEIYEQ